MSSVRAPLKGMLKELKLMLMAIATSLTIIFFSLIAAIVIADYIPHISQQFRETLVVVIMYAIAILWSLLLLILVLRKAKKKLRAKKEFLKT
mgnify:CR=1 FL=1